MGSDRSGARTAQSASSLKVDAYCSYFGGVGKTVRLAQIPDDFGSLTDVQVKIEQLKAYFNDRIDNRVIFETKVTQVNTAAAARSGSRRYILYNDAFYYELMKKAGTEWGPLSVFAHEIAHHVESHLLPSKHYSNKKTDQANSGQILIQELEADWFSGRILAKMGATLSQSTLAAEKILPFDATDTHPARNARIAIIKNGWRSVCFNNPSCSSEQSYETDALAIDQFTHDLKKSTWKYTCRLKGQQLLINADNKIYWIKSPHVSIGERLGTTRFDACAYEIALLGKRHCVTSASNRIVDQSSSKSSVAAVNNAQYHADICAPCQHGLCP